MENNPLSAGRGFMPRQVLVVEDDPVTRMVFSRMFARLGCTVLGVASAGELTISFSSIRICPTVTAPKSRAPSGPALMPPLRASSPSPPMMMTTTCSACERRARTSSSSSR
jgi:CheY-like chemotaxis protein